MGLNQRGADAGTIMQLNPTPGADFTAQLTRMRMVTYYIDNANPDQPRLVRRVNMNPGRVVAVGLDNLQFSYDLVDGITNPTNQDDPATPNQVRKINIEGEMLTMPEIAKRLNADIRAVRGRYAKALEQPGPVTWDKLRKQ